MKQRRILFWSITVALGGFLFGFDTAVISGAEQDIQGIWGLNSVQHGFTVSIALIGTVIGALFGGKPTRNGVISNFQRAISQYSESQSRV